MRRAAALARRLVPSVLARRAVALGAPRRLLPEWEIVPGGFAAGRRTLAGPGWDGERAAAAYRAKLPDFLALLGDTAPVAASTSPALPTRQATVARHNENMTFAYAVALAARGRERISVLDWGGGVGLCYHLARALFPGLELDYRCKDVPAVCAVGRELLPQAVFDETEACLDGRYDLVLASGSLEYAERWEETLAGLARATAGLLLVHRLPVVLAGESYVLRHRSRGIGEEWLEWALARDAVVAGAERAGLALVREFLLGDQPPVPRAPEQRRTRSYLFRSATTRAA